MKKNLIQKEMTMGEIIGKYPRLAQVLMEKYNLHCIGCGFSSFETLNEGALSHGMNNEQISSMVKELNKLIKE